MLSTGFPVGQLDVDWLRLEHRLRPIDARHTHPSRFGPIERRLRMGAISDVRALAGRTRVGRD